MIDRSNKLAGAGGALVFYNQIANTAIGIKVNNLVGYRCLIFLLDNTIY
jgi:hypothetical protein